MNLCNAQAASCREDNNSGGGGALRGTFDAAPANSLSVGAVGFGPMWSDEPSLRELYDTACASIVRAECEADELRAEVAMLKQAMLLLAQERDDARARVKVLSKCWREAEEERDEARLQYRSTHALAESLVKTIGELKAERVEGRLKLSDWRDCAKRLVAVVEYYHPDLRDESENGWSEERAAIGLFDDLERQHQVARDEACRESCRDKASADGGWANI
jgi:chromosome segregation ATPase